MLIYLKREMLQLVISTLPSTFTNLIIAQLRNAINVQVLPYQPLQSISLFILKAETELRLFINASQQNITFKWEKLIAGRVHLHLISLDLCDRYRPVSLCVKLCKLSMILSIALKIRCIVICVSCIENFTSKMCLALLPFIWIAGQLKHKQHFQLCLTG